MIDGPGHFEIVPAGDSALIVRFEERIDRAISARVVSIAGAIERAALAGVRDVVPMFRSVAVYFDPLRTDYDALIERLEREAVAPFQERSGDRPPLSIPVCYGGDLGPDLAAVASFARLTAPEVVALHAETTYLVFMLGFVPGFAYMGTVAPRIAMPRRATPRLRVPIGSVGIAGAQTGIYPAETPGGWALIGRTPVRPFDLGRAEPFLFAAGDLVQFRSIARVEYDRLLADRAAAID